MKWYMTHHGCDHTQIQTTLRDGMRRNLPHLTLCMRCGLKVTGGCYTVNFMTFGNLVDYGVPNALLVTSFMEALR